MMGRTSAEPEEVKARAHPVLAEVANWLVRKPGSSQAGAFMAMLAVESPLLGDEPLLFLHLGDPTKRPPLAMLPS